MTSRIVMERTWFTPIILCWHWENSLILLYSSAGRSNVSYFFICRRKNFFEDSKQDLFLFSASVIMGKWDRKRPGGSPFSCFQEEEKKSDHYCSSQHYHSTQGSSTSPTLLSTFRHHQQHSICLFMLWYLVHNYHQNFYAAFILCKKGKLMNAH